MPEIRQCARLITPMTGKRRGKKRLRRSPRYTGAVGETRNQFPFSAGRSRYLFPLVVMQSGYELRSMINVGGERKGREGNSRRAAPWCPLMDVRIQSAVTAYFPVNMHAARRSCYRIGATHAAAAGQTAPSSESLRHGRGRRDRASGVLSPAPPHHRQVIPLAQSLRPCFCCVPTHVCIYVRMWAGLRRSDGI